MLIATRNRMSHDNCARVCVVPVVDAVVKAVVTIAAVFRLVPGLTVVATRGARSPTGTVAVGIMWILHRCD